MKTSVLIPATALCAVLGWFLPPLWNAEQNAVPRRSALLPAVTQAPATIAATTRSAGSPMAQFRAVMAAVAGRGSSLAAATDAFDDFTIGEAGELAARFAGEELGRSVSDGAAFLRSLADMDYRVHDAALEAWSEKDPDAALRLMLSPPGDVDLDSIIDTDEDSFFFRLVARDPDKVLGLLRSAGAAASATGWETVIRAFARKDVARAFDALQSAPYATRAAGIKQILEVFTERDPRAAIEWAKALGPEWRRTIEWAPVYEKWAETDAAAAIEAWDAFSDPFETSAPDLAGVWLTKDPEAAIRWALKEGDSPNHANRAWIANGIVAIAASDPQRAIGMLDVVGESFRAAAIGPLAERWAASDFPAALAWSRTLTGDEQKEAFAALIEPARRLTHEERSKLAGEVGTSTPLGFGLLWSTATATAPALFAAMSPEMRGEIWTGLSASALMRSPEAAIDLIRTGLEINPPDELKNEIVPQFFAEWSVQDPVAAAGGVKRLPPGDAQALAVQNLIDSWSRSDLEGATAWTRTLPDGPAKDKAMQQLASTARIAGDPAAALKWAASIQDTELRESILESNFDSWRRIDPDAARTVFNALPLDPFERERILSGGRPPPPFPDFPPPPPPDERDEPEPPPN
ncbi:MAG TPA: hypothetical protein VG796_12135 [Verrucomicrobiales bacterium]|nr:hypothetical protein [Verrucomicrobiales bacterium]